MLLQHIYTDPWIMIYTWKSLKDFKLPEVNSTKPCSMYSIKLQRSLYGLKQYGRMWYNRLSEYLLKKGMWITLYAYASSLRNQKSDLCNYCSVCWWLKSCWNSWRAHKNNKLLEKGIWDERFWKNKILSQPADWTFFKWSFSTLINIY